MFHVLSSARSATLAIRCVVDWSLLGFDRPLDVGACWIMAVSSLNLTDACVATGGEAACLQHEVLRSLHQRALDVLRVLQHCEAPHEALPTFLRGIDRPKHHAMVCEPLLGHDRAAFQ